MVPTTGWEQKTQTWPCSSVNSVVCGQNGRGLWHFLSSPLIAAHRAQSHPTWGCLCASWAESRHKRRSRAWPSGSVRLRFRSTLLTSYAMVGKQSNIGGPQFSRAQIQKSGAQLPFVGLLGGRMEKAHRCLAFFAWFCRTLVHQWGFCPKAAQQRSPCYMHRHLVGTHSGTVLGRWKHVREGQRDTWDNLEQRRSTDSCFQRRTRSLLSSGYYKDVNSFKSRGEQNGEERCMEEKERKSKRKGERVIKAGRKHRGTCH